MTLPTFDDEATFGDLLDPAMEIAKARDHKAAKAYVEGYQKYLITVHAETPERALEIIKINVGYYAGYYDQETRAAVQEVFGAAHPIFGSVTPTPEQAFDAGFLEAQGVQPL